LDTLTGHPVNDKMVKLTMQTIDDDGNGCIELEEFVEWYVAEKIEGPQGYGYVQKVMTPVCTFGTYTAFGLGPSSCTYVAKNECEIYAISTEALMHEFGEDNDVMDLIEYCLLGPATKYGPFIDIDGPSENEKEAYINEYKDSIKKKKKNSPQWQSNSKTQRRWSTRASQRHTSKVAPQLPSRGRGEYRDSPSQPSRSKSLRLKTDSGSRLRTGSGVVAQQLEGINQKLDWNQENMQHLQLKMEDAYARMEKMYNLNEKIMKQLIESNATTMKKVAQFEEARVTL